VKALFLLGGNPAFTMPGDLKFGEAMKRATVVALTHDANETAKAAEWHLAEAHALESWGDARAADGTISIQQPLVEPLWMGRSVLEVAGLLAGSSRKGYEIVRGYWLAQWGAEGARKWETALFDGMVQGTANAPATPAIDAKAVFAKASSEIKAAESGMEVAFYPGSGAYDGRYLNNAWMNEAPDPMTKLVWDNAALLSPATARQLGVENGSLLSLSKDGRTITAPAMVLPGHVDNSISLSLGYGRAEVGRVGRGVGHSVEALRGSSSFGFLQNVSVSKASGTHELVTTQEHHTMKEPITGVTRPIVREATLEHYREHPDVIKHMVHEPEAISLFGSFDYSQGTQWGMAIDLNACIGCNACLVACQSENNIPVVGKDQVKRGREMHWVRLDRYFTGSEEDPQAVMQPMACVQCEAAPCESVCPVAATVHSPEGLNDMAYNRCVGTRYCANNCPYKVRRFNFLEWNKDVQESQKMVFNPDVTVRMRGVMEKCNYCVQRIQEKKIAAKSDNRRSLKDGEVQTACQQVCPADAITFGNINDPESRVAKMKKQPRDYTVLGELNTKPRTTYLAKLRNPNPELETSHG
jgi:molybdopterin-containing oxidoreductase family iron-sulfur binding subunit